MSFQAMAWAATVRTGSPTEKLVLWALANVADDVGECFPSQQRIANDTELSKRSVLRAMKALEDKGLITRQARHRKTDGTRSSDLIHLAINIMTESHQAEPKVTACHTQGDRESPQYKPNGLSEPVREPSGQKPQNPRVILESILSKQSAKDIIEHRQKLKKPLGRRAAELLVIQLSRCRDPNAAADMMIERGWQGFKAEWFNNAQGQENGQTRELTESERIAILRA